MHLLVCFSILLSSALTGSETVSSELSSRHMIHHYSTNDVQQKGLTKPEFLTLLRDLTTHSPDFVKNVLTLCGEDDHNCTWRTLCPGMSEIYKEFSVDGLLTVEGLSEALPVAINTLTSYNCTKEFIESRDKGHRKPSPGAAWGYGIGFVTLVCVISNIGVFLGPVMNTVMFKRILQFLVAMGAGSLAATGLLVLIPEAFDIMAAEEILGTGYIWKATLCIFSIYIFFSGERLLKTFLQKRKKSDLDIKDISIDVSSVDNNLINNVSEKSEVGGHSHNTDRTTLAWMVMAGDIIHNFVDGLSIGAAFTENIGVGISISLAVVCEELPHELADIAILLHSGLSLKKSLLINFLSACVCYIGLVLGNLLGSNIDEASKWIFSIAGGLFLYVPLVDMLPEMRSHLDLEISRSSSEARIVAILHIVGLVVGACIIIFIINITEFIVVD